MTIMCQELRKVLTFYIQGERKEGKEREGEGEGGRGGEGGGREGGGRGQKREKLSRQLTLMSNNPMLPLVTGLCTCCSNF